MRAPLDVPQAFCLRWSNHQANLVSVMDDLLVHKKLTDVALGTDDGPLLWCHKVILATCSPYFRRLFIDTKSHNPIVLLKDASYPIVKILLEYMYRGEVNVSQDNVTALLELAALLQVKGLSKYDGMAFESPQVAPSSPEAYSTSSNGYEESPRTSENSRSNSSQHSYTNAPLNERIETPNHRETNDHEPQPSIPQWPMSSMVLTEEQQSAVAAFANLHPFPTTTNSLAQFYDNSSDSTCTRNLNHQASRNTANAIPRDTSILRSVLNPEQDDAALRLPVSRQETRNPRHRNRKNRSPQHVDRRGNYDSLQMPSTSRERDPPVMEPQDHGITSQTLTEPRPSVSSYGVSQRQENKRYKKYDPKDIWNAIAEVQRGLSANKAAEKFKVPSRTLYDKIKKLKTSQSRQKRGEAMSHGGNMQYDIRGNSSTAIGLGNMTNVSNEESSDSIENPISMVETSFADIRERLNDPENKMNVDRESPMPRVTSANSQPQSPSQSQTYDNEEEAEDLTVSRRPSADDALTPNSDNEENL